ncbi:hypothetical protein G4B88_004979 [Cannabis sativa]|uniref:Protein kinase domain-containing protein n=1 Tax=Cannabis sativa TaxID=3483 RepID=A0A7J6FZN7_CANSA|nr:hypothetical protein G4B88_004979 [Cannabis sativa]
MAANPITVFFLLLITQILLFSISTAQQNNTTKMISLISSISTSTKNSYWLSNSGQFGFGFYKQGNGFSIGIWFDNIKEKIVVWTWNRDQQQPLPQSTTLVLNDFANFVSPDHPAASASMLDSGNFVLYNSDSKIIWQSFENPTDTLLNAYCVLDQNQQPNCTCLPGHDFIDQLQRNKVSLEEFYEVLWENNSYSIVPKNSRIACEQDCLKDCQCKIVVYTSNTCNKLRLPLRYAKPDQRNINVVTIVKVLKQSSEATTTWVTKGRSERVRNRFLISSVVSNFHSHTIVYKESNRQILKVDEVLTVRSFTSNELEIATNFFMEPLGKGSFGTVFKGTLRFPEGERAIAVKRLEKVAVEGEVEFLNEMRSISRTHHKNLVRLLDFGLAKILMPDQTRTHTGIRGTRGFGIVLLVIICCRLSVDVSVPEKEAILVDWVYECFMNNNSKSLMTNEEVNEEEFDRLLKIGIWCIQEEPTIRPPMKKVVAMLEGTLAIPIPPCIVSCNDSSLYFLDIAHA